jgi:DNA-binding GntR family transcriptional regulator
VTGTPIREAPNQLSTEGFVPRRERRGFHVAEASMTELE